MAKVRQRKLTATSHSNPRIAELIRRGEKETVKSKPVQQEKQFSAQAVSDSLDELIRLLELEQGDLLKRLEKRYTVDDGVTYEVTTIDQASRKEFWSKRVQFKANVVAKAISPYLVPHRVKIVCGMKDERRCFGCAAKDQSTFVVDLMDERSIALVDAPRTITRQLIAEILDIPGSCKGWSLEVEEKANIIDLYVSGAFSSIITNEEVDAVRRVLYIGHDIAANAVYVMKAKVASSPKTNEVVYLVDKVIAERDDILDIEVTPEMKEAVKFFQPENPNDPRSIKHRLTQIYEDFADNVTGIYGRQPLHEIIDLGYHSVLCWRWEGDPPDKLLKGTTEILIVGDSGQGKSEAMMRIRDHYGRGERIDCKSATYAGLVGGIDDFGGRRFMVWGRVPQNDRGCIILDEVKGMPTELVAQLTDVRSSQLAIVTRVGGTRRASARVRYFWLSNPRGRLRVSEYGHGVTAIIDLLGSPEDVRRIDMALILSSGEVAQEFIDGKITSTKRIEHRFTQDRCRALLKLVWSRVHTVIIKEVKKYIVQQATELSRKYSPQIPLLEPADARLKIARMAIALAARVGSFTPDFSGVAVKKCHVDVVVEFLQEVYDANNFAFNRWSAGQKRETEVETGEQGRIKDMIRQLPSPQIFLDTIAGVEWLTWDIIRAACGGDREHAERIVSEFLSSHYFTQYRRSYRKTPKLIAMIRAQREDSSIPLHLEKPPAEDEDGDIPF